MYPSSIYTITMYNHHIQYANSLIYSSHAVQCMIISSVLSSMIVSCNSSPSCFHINFINHNNYTYNHLTLNESDASGPIPWPAALFNVHYPHITIAIDIQFTKTNGCFQKSTCFVKLQAFVTLGHTLHTK